MAIASKTCREADASARVGVFLYDESCGFCSWCVEKLQGLIVGAGFDVLSLQEASNRQLLNVPPDRLLQDVRLIRNDGSVIEGANVYRCVLKRRWFLWPLYALSVVPLLSTAFDFCYRVVNKNRYRISRAFGLSACSVREPNSSESD